MSEKNADAGVEEEETSTDSSTENETGETDASSSEGGAEDQTDFNKFPLDKHPRWAEREANWNKRFEDQQKTFDEKIAGLAPKAAENKISVAEPIPKWFGGNQGQWDDYVSWHNKGIKEAEDRAYERLSTTQSAKEKAISDANTWFAESVSAIEKEAGKGIDRDALLKTCIDNELIDSKGRWNYKAAWQILKGKATDATEGRTERKKLAADTGKDGGRTDAGDNKGIKTAADFRKERPW